jgi:hypothetical protein
VTACKTLRLAALLMPLMARTIMLLQGLEWWGLRQAAEPDVSTTSSLVGSDTVNENDLLTSINALETKINNLLAKLRTHGLIAT